ncbi:MAG: hypothetical protein NTX33_14060 [Propionibacteriales bacterium]|nr:hypothetical protein [Propionibacteriales bacterium]
MTPPEWNTYVPEPAPEGEPAQTPHTTPGAKKPRPKTGRARGRGFHPVGLLITVIGVIVAIGVPVLFAVLGSEGGLGGGEPQSRAGFTEMLDELREETGGTTVFEAVIYPEYAILDVPLKPGDEREISYRWDGGGLEEWTKGTSDYVPFDLAQVDGIGLNGMCDAALDLVEDPTVCYLIVRHPREGLDEGWIWAYTSNDFSQGGYINYSLSGTEVRRTTW